MVEKEEFIGKFIFHLYDTHGIPMEIIMERIKKCTHETFVNETLQHKDFLKQWKSYLSHTTPD
jgi:alanyl-tRNA synthetase